MQNDNNTPDRKNDRLLTVKEVSLILGFKPHSIRNMISKNETEALPPHRRLGTGERAPIRFWESDVHAFIDA